MSTQSYKNVFYVLLGANTLLRFLLALAVPITYKEAYYFEWSQYLSAGYLDHPPMVSWIIAFTTSLFSQHHVFAVRIGSLLMGSGTLYLLYQLTLKLFRCEKTAFRASLIAACFPVFNALWFMMVPDSPLLFFQLLALNLFVSAYQSNRLWQWGAFGIVSGLALLSKVVFALTLVTCVLYLVYERAKKASIVSLLSIGLSLLIFTPFILWNQSHEWANFRLQLWERHLWDFGLSFNKIGEVTFEQLVAMTPLLLPLIIGSLFIPTQSLSEEWKAPMRFVKMQTALVLGICCFAGFFITQTHPHWTSLALAPASILLAASWTAFPNHKLTMKLPTFTRFIQSVYVAVVLLITVAPQIIVHVQPEWLPRQLGNGLIKGRQCLLGYSALNHEINRRIDVDGLPEDTLLFTDAYQFAAPLSFETERHPVICLPSYVYKGQRMGYAQPYYLPPSTLKGKNGLFIAHTKGDCKPLLEDLFETVEELEPLTQRFEGHVIGEYRLYRVENLSL